jgi:hypothetical protein
MRIFFLNFLNFFFLEATTVSGQLVDWELEGWPYIPDRKLITNIIEKLPLLERLGLGGGVFQEQLLVAVLNHCPRLELLDASNCRPMFRVWQEPIATRIKSTTIKKLLLPSYVLF